MQGLLSKACLYHMFPRYTHQIPTCLDPADAKVCNLGAAIDVQQDVLWLEVPVHDAGVQVRQPLCHVMCYLQVPPDAEFSKGDFMKETAWQR